MCDNSNDRGIRVLLWSLLLVCASSAQAALISASSAVVYDEGFFTGSVTINGTPANSAGSSSSTVGYNSSIVGGLATSGHGEALFGALHASAFSAAANPGVGATAQTRGLGSAVWIDQITISSPTLTGAAFARAVFSLSGGLNSLSDAAATGNSTIAATVRINGGTVFSTTGQLVSSGAAITTNEINRGQAVNGLFQTDPVSSLTGDFSFDIPFAFGTPFQMMATLDAFTQALSGAAGAVASAHSNFDSSGLWGGISEVHLADGTVLSGYSLSSDSGFDWTNAFAAVPGPGAVPIPATMWLFGLGLLALIGVARRKNAA
jgi:hypothetical protein